jgi:hypothetical protein
VEPLASPDPRWRRVLRDVLDAGAVAAALGFIASYFPASVMLTPTTTNGGDMGSHYWPAYYLRHVLLPHGHIVGWCPGNYCGFPLFQFYFWLPFLLMSVLSLAIPLAVAFKLVSVLGTFLLPACAYFGLRLSGVPFPGPALGTLATLPFIFMEANSMWGGNIPSTLAGEFTFSLSMSFAVLFLGTLRRTVDTGRGRIGNAVLVALIGVSHGYTLLWAGLTSLTELIATHGWWRRVGTLVAVHGLGFLLMAFWLVPLLGYSAWTTAYSHVWYLQSWQEVMPPVLWLPSIVAVATTLVLLVVAAVRREAFPRGLAKIWAGVLFGGVLYYSARTFHVVDIRFIPFFQLGLCLAAGAGLGYLFAKAPAPEIWPVVFTALVLPYVQGGFPTLPGRPGDSGPVVKAIRALGAYHGVSFIPSWITWNYSGYEKKGPWPVFKGINDKLHGDFRDPRVVFEHSGDHEALGTIRAFENLPFFSGRSTLEGLYMQASPSAPFIFYTQSEISKEQSCPFPDYGCSRFNLDRGLEHLRMFNVSHFIVKSQQVKTAAATNTGLTREAKIGDYEIYRVEGNDGRYAIPLATAPVLVLTDQWKDVAYRWFKRARPSDPTPVFAESATPEEQAQFGAVVRDLPPEWPAKPLADVPALEETMEREDRITVTGCRPGQPVLIRVSFHPRWRALTGEKIWLAAPSFMLVFPRGERVDLVFDGGGPVTLGASASVVGWLVLVLALLPAGRRFGARLVESAPAQAVLALVRSTGAWSDPTRRVLLAAALVVAAAFLGAAAYAARTSDADSTYRYGQVIYDQGRLRDSLPYFRAAQRLAPLSNTAIHSTYYESIVLYREHDWAEAEKAFQKLVDRSPEANAAAESQYHIGLCRKARGDTEGAIAAWERTQQVYPGTQWAGYAGERLAEVRK